MNRSTQKSDDAQDRVFLRSEAVSMALVGICKNVGCHGVPPWCVDKKIASKKMESRGTHTEDGVLVRRQAGNFLKDF